MVAAAAAASDKLATDIVILDVGDVLAITDWFLIATGGNSRHVRTIADEVTEVLRADGAAPPRVEGRDDAIWVLLDFGEVVVHVFQREARDYYSLERLWSDVDRVDWSDEQHSQAAEA